MVNKRNFDDFSNFVQTAEAGNLPNLGYAETLSSMGYDNFLKRSMSRSRASSSENSACSSTTREVLSLSDGSESIGIGANPTTIITDIMDAYNAGHIEKLKDFLMESASPFCEVHFSALQHLFLGQAALCSLWDSLFEAFPNGVFRAAKSTTDEEGKSSTTFRFYGTKIFPLVIDTLPFSLQPRTGPSPDDFMRSRSLVADLSRPIYDTAQLLTTAVLPEMVFEGVINLVLDDDDQIKIFEFSWTRVV